MKTEIKLPEDNILKARMRLVLDLISKEESVYELLELVDWDSAYIYSLLRKMNKNKLIDYGVSINYPWLTPLGKEYLKEFNKLIIQHKGR